MTLSLSLQEHVQGHCDCSLLPQHNVMNDEICSEHNLLDLFAKDYLADPGFPRGRASNRKVGR